MVLIVDSFLFCCQAIHLCCYLKTAELPGVDYVSEVLQELERQIDMVLKRDKKSSHKATKVKYFTT
jgi:hypothetical protein